MSRRVGEAGRLFRDLTYALWLREGDHWLMASELSISCDTALNVRA
jgi:hypothetical protein